MRKNHLRYFRLMFLLLGGTVLFSVATLIIVAINKHQSKRINMQTIFPSSSDNFRIQNAPPREYLSINSPKMARDIENAIKKVEVIEEDKRTDLHNEIRLARIEIKDALKNRLTELEKVEDEKSSIRM